jgi:hypothetical protein
LGGRVDRLTADVVGPGSSAGTLLATRGGSVVATTWWLSDETGSGTVVSTTSAPVVAVTTALVEGPVDVDEDPVEEDSVART